MTPDDELVLRLALTRLRRLRPEHQRMLYDALDTALDIYNSIGALDKYLPSATHALRDELAQLDGHIQWARDEMQYCYDHGIDILRHDDARFPTLLNQCHDAPTILYSKGSADYNAPHIVASVGTRHCTEYGKSVCRHFFADIARQLPRTLVVSGLAYGIDIESHRAALAAGLPTVAVVAHGLDCIYPTVHRATANEMQAHGGGILTEYPHATRIDKRNFVSRNRIVAGMSHATIVVESAEKGGSLITAELATDYDREVFACPGRMGDAQSMGCNALIARQRAHLLLSAEGLLATMDWAGHSEPVQGELFPILSAEEESIRAALERHDEADIETLADDTGIAMRPLRTLLAKMEMDGLLRLTASDYYRWN